MSRFCVVAIVTASHRDAANAALLSANLPAGLSVELVAGYGLHDAAPGLVATHFAQHSWEDQPTIDAMRAIADIDLLVWSGAESEGALAALEAAWQWAQGISGE